MRTKRIPCKTKGKPIINTMPPINSHFQVIVALIVVKKKTATETIRIIVAVQKKGIFRVWLLFHTHEVAFNHRLGLFLIRFAEALKTEVSTGIFWGFSLEEKGRSVWSCFSMVSIAAWRPWNIFPIMILIIAITISYSQDSMTRSWRWFEICVAIKMDRNTVIWFGENC